jgi:NhaP-type Na+/H+ or K+/H+ antiporter
MVHKRQAARILTQLLIKASPGVSNPILEFFYNFILFMILGCVLGYRSWIDAVVTLRMMFLFILVKAILGGISLAHAMLRY